MAGGEIASAYLSIYPKLEGKSVVDEITKSMSGAGTKAGTSLADNAKRSMQGGMRDAGESIGDRISDGISAKAVVIGNVITDALRAAVSSAVGIGKEIAGGIYEGYAQNEQLVGGMQKLFGKVDYKTVVKNANDAFMTAGMSANDYMSTVTSFSASLISSLGGDTKAAAKLADQAIRDMSDNVNTFGTDAQSVQNAVMGIAKGNYSMLDNLSLGFAGSQQGMVDLINASGVLDHKLEKTSELADVGFGTMLEAIHAVQEDMKITGTTANEAMGTLEGSATATKAAWENVLTSIGSGDASQVTSATSGLIDAVFGTIDSESGKREGGLISNLTGLARNAFEALGAALPDMFNMALDALPPDVGEPIRAAFETIGEVIETVAPVVSTAIGAIVTAIGKIAPVVLPLVPLIASVLGAVKIVGVITSIVGAVTTFVTTAGAAIGMIGSIPGLIAVVTTALGGPITIIGAIIGAIVAFIATNEDAREAVLKVWEGLKKGITDTVSNLSKAIPAKWNEMKTKTQAAWNNIKTFITNAWTAIKGTVLNAANNVFNTVKNAFNNVKTAISSAMNNAKNAISNAFNNAKSAVSNAVGAIRNAVSNGFNAVVGFVAGIPGRIIGAFSGLSGSMSNIGWNIMQGLAGGIASGLSSAVSAAANAARSLVSGAKRVLGISSPSKVFAEIGAYTMEGMAIGIEREFGKSVLPALADVEKGITAPIDIPSRTYSAAGASYANTSRGGVVVTGNTFVVRNDADIAAIGRAINTQAARQRRAAL